MKINFCSDYFLANTTMFNYGHYRDSCDGGAGPHIKLGSSWTELVERWRVDLVCCGWERDAGPKILVFLQRWTGSLFVIVSSVNTVVNSR